MLNSLKQKGFAAQAARPHHGRRRANVGRQGALAFAENRSVHGVTPTFYTGREFMDPALEKEIECLRQSKVKELQNRYRRAIW